MILPEYASDHMHIRRQSWYLYFRWHICTPCARVKGTGLLYLKFDVNVDVNECKSNFLIHSTCTHCILIYHPIYKYHVGSRSGTVQKKSFFPKKITTPRIVDPDLMCYVGSGFGHFSGSVFEVARIQVYTKFA